MRSPVDWLGELAREEVGTAAIEFALVVGLLSYGLLNGTDMARYFFMRTAVENATQMAAQVGWKTCDSSNLPATTLRLLPLVKSWRAGVTRIAVTRDVIFDYLRAPEGANIQLELPFAELGSA